MANYDSDSPIPPPPPPERQVTHGGLKHALTTAVSKDSGKWVVVQQGGNLKISTFLKKSWNGGNVSADEFDLNTMFWFHISNPEGDILNLHVNLQGLVARLASLGIHSENDIYLINDEYEEQTEMDIDFEARVQRLFFSPPDEKTEGDNNAAEDQKI